ncbi:MAG: hypothetical protein GY856_13245 [bacterium]|nr:hypothetical protein [bacterium]
MNRPPSRQRLGPWALLGAAVLMLLVFHAIGGSLMDGHRLGLGSLNEPTPRYGRFLALWTVFGGGAAIFLAVGLFRLLTPARADTRILAAWRRSSDLKWILYGSTLAFLIPAALRGFLLRGAPLTDDESAYRFMAEVLAMGRWVADSPPLKLFFDNRFMINDGKLYSQYFIGWPALMAPGVRLGTTGLMNAFYSALTLPGLFLVVRRLAGGHWAKVSVVLYLVSPMLMVAAATEISHTSCLMALVWLAWCCLRTRDPDAAWWYDAGVALLFSIAFFIRPATALGIAAPMLVWWLAGLRPLGPRRRAGALAAFIVPAVLTAALFLTVNKIQNGSVFEVAYNRAYTYAQENDFRFSAWRHETDHLAPDFDFGDLSRSLAVAGSALFRFNFAFLGWPCSLLFVFFARGGSFVRVLWWSALCFVAVHFFTNSVGVDTFAPMHHIELALPALILSVLGLRCLCRLLHTAAGPLVPRARVFAPVLGASLLAVSLAGYIPVRLAAIHRIAASINAPRDLLRAEGIDRGVVFASDPFIHPCSYRSSRGWVFVRPNNDPRLENDILWVNHLSVEKDKALMSRFPDRRGYVMVWLEGCRLAFPPLEEIPPGVVPDARIRGLSEVSLDDS